MCNERSASEFAQIQSHNYSLLQSKIAVMDISGETYELGAFIEKALGICAFESLNNTNTFSTKSKLEFTHHFSYFKEFEAELREYGARRLFSLIPYGGNFQLNGKRYYRVLVKATPNAIRDLAVTVLKVWPNPL